MKRLFNSMPQPASVAFLLLFVASAAVSASAQNIVVDWRTGNTQCPSEVSRPQSGRVIVQNVNRILFRYRVRIQGTPRVLNDAGHVFVILRNSLAPRPSPAVPGPSTAPCGEALIQTGESLMQQINDVIQNDPALPLGYSNTQPFRTVPYETSRAAWDRIRPQIDQLRRTANTLLSSCPEVGPVAQFLNQFRDVNRQLVEIETNVFADQEVSTPIRLEPEFDYAGTVEELFRDTRVGEAVNVDCKPPSNQLFLSAGVLVSRIQDRVYEARKVPGMDENALVVEGNSQFRPAGVALLNYTLPNLDRGAFGLALSAGPVFRFGSESDTSSLGFFTGVSAHINRRYFITPGFHFGEFADFPAGFTEGQTVPTNFGELNPVKRWTARFALGFTFRAASFDGLVGSSADSGGSGGSGGSQPDDDDGGGDNNNNNNDNDDNDDSGGSSNSGRRPKGKRARNVAAAGRKIAPVNEYPSFMRTASLRGRETRQGTVVTIAADSPINDYTTFSSGNVFYVVIPNAKGRLGQSALAGRNFGSAKLEQSGSNLVISFVVPQGCTARLRQSFNRLEVSFTNGGATPSGAPALAEANRD